MSRKDEDNFFMSRKDEDNFFIIRKDEDNLWQPKDSEPLFQAVMFLLHFKIFCKCLNNWHTRKEKNPKQIGWSSRNLGKLFLLILGVYINQMTA